MPPENIGLALLLNYWLPGWIDDKGLLDWFYWAKSLFWMSFSAVFAN